MKRGLLVVEDDVDALDGFRGKMLVYLTIVVGLIFGEAVIEVDDQEGDAPRISTDVIDLHLAFGLA